MTNTQDELDLIYRNGYSAFLEGLSNDQNPHDSTSEEFSHWNEGWLDANHDAI